MAVELAKGVYWVGVVDWNMRHFHGYELSTHRGTTYNSYLIVDKKIALVDTSLAGTHDQLISNIRSIVDPAKIDYMVTNHAEMDHSGSLPEILKLCPNATVVVSKKGAESVPGHYHRQWNFKVVKTGDRISLGENDLVFIEAQMLHWPDSMFTYFTGQGGILLSNDAFGQHYAAPFMFNDQVNNEELYEEAHKYYANILTPFSDLVLKKIDEVLALKLPVSIIGPSHGIIWRKDPLQIVKKYQEWARQVPEKTAVILYDTMWEATKKMAEAISGGLASEGVSSKIYLMPVSDRNDVITELLKTKAILIGSPVLNRGVLPTMAPILEDIRGLRFKNKIGAAFGSYGWSGECVKILEENLKKSGIQVCAEGVLAQWQPKPEDLEKCRALGVTVAKAIKA